MIIAIGFVENVAVDNISSNTLICCLLSICFSSWNTFFFISYSMWFYQFDSFGSKLVDKCLKTDIFMKIDCYLIKIDFVMNFLIKNGWFQKKIGPIMNNVIKIWIQIVLLIQLFWPIRIGRILGQQCRWIRFTRLYWISLLIVPQN